MFRYFKHIFLIAAFLSTLSSYAGDEKRIALLIGNSQYRSAPLANPINDVKDMGDALKTVGFEVTKKENLNFDKMKSEIQSFSEKIKKNKDTVGFFFFAGHGVQVNGKNYLLPIDREYSSEKDVETFALDISYLMHRLEEASGRISVVILDACRNNPFYIQKTKSNTPQKGLAPVEAPSGALVAFSTAPGTEASDGSGKNGLYSKHLLSNIRVPGLTIEQVFKRTRESVERESGGTQSPREESSLKGDDFYITPLDGLSFKSPFIGSAADIAFWETIKYSSFANDFKSYLKEFPQGIFISLAQSRISELSTELSKKSSTTTTPVTLRVGDVIPDFSLQSASGKTVSSEQSKESPVSIFYFFNDKKNCNGCSTSLSSLKQISDQYQKEGIKVLAFGNISSGEFEKIKSPINENFHLFSTNEKLTKDFHISDMLPTTVVATKGGVITNVIHGGGIGNDKIITALADSMLSRGNPATASRLFNSLKGIQTALTVAQIGQAWALHKEGKQDDAAAIFRAAVADGRKDMMARGHEGLAALALVSGDLDNALSSAQSALQIAPNRTTALLVKAKVLIAKGSHKEAEDLIALASSSTAVSDFSWQVSEATTARGNLLRKLSPTTAMSAYKEALDANPFSSDALANQGSVLQAMGEPAKALEVLRLAAERAPKDRAVIALLRQAEQASKQKMDLERQRYIDDSVKELVARFKEQRMVKPGKVIDDWTSQVIAVSVLDFQSSGDTELLGKVGMDRLLLQEFSQALTDAGITVVDRALLDKLLAELKLGSSELADPDTQLRLGRLMASRLITTGNLVGSGEGKFLSMRVIDTETTQLAYAKTMRNIAADPVSVAESMAAALAKSIRDKYPLKGRIAVAEDDAAIVINLGKKHGARPGLAFNVLGDSAPIELNGRILGYRETRLGQIEITQTEELMSYAKVIDKKGAWAKNQKIIAKAIAD